MDESSVISSSQKSVASLQDDVEESGWTSYIEYFYNNNNNGEEDNSSSNFTVSPSLVSDGATGISEQRNQIAGSENFPRKLRPKPEKKFCDDDSLEDTASSPVNSPKVSYMQQIEMKPKKNSGSSTISSSFLMGKEPGEDRTEKDDKKTGTNLDANNELRRRGLCLVPVSMFADCNNS